MPVACLWLLQGTPPTHFMDIVATIRKHEARPKVTGSGRNEHRVFPLHCALRKFKIFAPECSQVTRPMPGSMQPPSQLKSKKFAPWLGLLNDHLNAGAAAIACRGAVQNVPGGLSVQGLDSLSCDSLHCIAGAVRHGLVLFCEPAPHAGQVLHGLQSPTSATHSSVLHSSSCSNFPSPQPRVVLGQSLLRLRKPPPHDLEHLLQAFQLSHSPKQFSCRVQSCFLLSLLAQGLSFLGHFRLLIWTPTPQVTEHASHCNHSPTYKHFLLLNLRSGPHAVQMILPLRFLVHSDPGPHLGVQSTSSQSGNSPPILQTH